MRSSRPAAAFRKRSGSTPCRRPVSLPIGAKWLALCAQWVVWRGSERLDVCGGRPTGTRTGSAQFLGQAHLPLGVISTVVIIAAGIFGIYKGWKELNTAEACRFSGTAHLLGTTQPAPGASIGYASNRDQVFPGGSAPMFVKLAESGADGTYSGACDDIADSPGAGSFELLTTPGLATCPGLPPVGPDAISYSNVRVSNEGEHTGINLNVRC